ncbi:hypothetical protein ZEAMMB73_Zm00001d034077 [Zea mays]|uniref:Uncharacterized protein n=1 Tax=Zea mays TaxID=4577 RepID=A0A1D6L5B7_MAIZE|nr:hypothetical protein ZEAMMB73_Zm00001d034077 [Zea mays]
MMGRTSVAAAAAALLVLAACAALPARTARSVLLHGGAGGRGAGGRGGLQQVRLHQRHLQLQQGAQLRLPAQRDQDLLLHLQLRLLLRRDAPRHQGREVAAAVAAAVRQRPLRRRHRRLRQVPRARHLRRRRRARRAAQDGLAGKNLPAGPFVGSNWDSFFFLFVHPLHLFRSVLGLSRGAVAGAGVLRWVH